MARLRRMSETPTAAPAEPALESTSPPPAQAPVEPDSVAATSLRATRSRGRRWSWVA